MISQGAQTVCCSNKTFQNEQRVAEHAGDHDAVEPGELVGGEVVVGDPSAGPQILAVGAGINGTDRNHETQTVGQGDLSPPQAPTSGTLVWA